jgi:hypothetical protein
MSLWVFDEFYQTQSDVTEATEYIKKVIHGRRLISNLTDFSNSVLQDSLELLWPSVFVNDEKHYTKRHSLVRRIQALQTALKIHDDGSTDIHFHKNCENIITDFRSCKWPERKKEELEMAEVELPTTKYISSPAAISYIVAFSQIAQGINIYEAQMVRAA